LKSAAIEYGLLSVAKESKNSGFMSNILTNDMKATSAVKSLDQIRVKPFRNPKHLKTFATTHLVSYPVGTSPTVLTW